MLKELLGDAAARVLHSEDVFSVAVGARSFLGAEDDISAVFVILRGVVEKLHEYLRKPRDIRDNIGMEQIIAVYYKAQVLGIHHGRHGLFDITDHIRKAALDLRERRFSRFHSRDLKRFADDSEQLVSRDDDLVCILLGLLAVADIHLYEIREAENGVERRFDIMRHIGKERVFRNSGGLRL